jgi:hypothetical protein
MTMRPADAESDTRFVSLDPQPQHVLEVETDGAVLCLDVVPPLSPERTLETVELFVGDTRSEGRACGEADRDALSRARILVGGGPTP